MAQLDEIQFCTIAGNIRTLGELTQDRFDGAMAQGAERSSEDGALSAPFSLQ